jgi:hypothetical protein
MDGQCDFYLCDDRVFNKRVESVSGVKTRGLFCAYDVVNLTACWKRKTSPTADDEIRPDNQDSGPFTGIRSSGPPIGDPLSPD